MENKNSEREQLRTEKLEAVRKFLKAMDEIVKEHENVERTLIFKLQKNEALPISKGFEKVRIVTHLKIVQTYIEYTKKNYQFMNLIVKDHLYAKYLPDHIFKSFLVFVDFQLNLSKQCSEAIDMAAVNMN